MELQGVLIDIDHISSAGRSIIRLTVKNNSSVYSILDKSFYPYFKLVPYNINIDESSIEKMLFRDQQGNQLAIHGVTKTNMTLSGKEKTVLKVETNNSRNVPEVSKLLSEFGESYEYDILYWKRYLIDKKLNPLHGVSAVVHEEGGELILDSIKELDKEYVLEKGLSYMCFDIETYNPSVVPRPDKDPAIMISYYAGGEAAVLTTKKINRDFVRTFANEKEMISAFVKLIKEKDIDILSGYNSSNFDIPYLMKRAEKNGIDFHIGRYDEDVRQEHHGLLEAIRIPGRINLDVYNVARFVSIVGASEKLIKINRFTLSEVYRAISGDTKITVDKNNIWQIWDGSDADLEELADYSLSDSVTLNKLYEFFINLQIETSKVSRLTLAENAVSTTGQLVEALLMRYASDNNEIVPNKPSQYEISDRMSNPIEGAFVKTPEAGIYDGIVVFDFRSLYPSIIISHNIDPSTIAYPDYKGKASEAPNGTKFMASPMGIVPKALKKLLDDRKDIKKAYKNDPDNQTLAARSSALKILANSFYGYLGYARSRWYSRECAASVTAFGRSYITMTIEEAEKTGFKVLYGDTDSIFLQTQGKSKEEAMKFLEEINAKLPETMELELEDYYVRGVFVGKKGNSSAGAKKKYALLSEAGRVKIKGFELVRRDWSNIARTTQKEVLEAILKEGSKEKAIQIVKDVLARLRDGKVELKDLIIYTQLRKGIDKYDAKSPELAAARKAIQKGAKTKEEVEGSTIGYIITRSGNTISEKAEIDELADSYDPDYYINHQVVPATLKILKELGFSEEELKGGGVQKRL
jgi:DNA polymerase I